MVSAVFSWLVANPTQVGVTLFSLIAIYFTTSRDPLLRRRGPVFGLTSQPFWLVATAQAAQWGMFALSWVYVAMWCRGIWNFWREDCADTLQAARVKNRVFRSAGLEDAFTQQAKLDQKGAAYPGCALGSVDCLSQHCGCKGCTPSSQFVEARAAALRAAGCVDKNLPHLNMRYGRSRVYRDD